MCVISNVLCVMSKISGLCVISNVLCVISNVVCDK